jgi:hypothetical protein
LNLSQINNNLSEEKGLVLENIALNLLTIQCYESIRGPLSKPPNVNLEQVTNQHIKQALPNDIPNHLVSIIRTRLEYWLANEKKFSWSKTIGRISKRTSPKNGIKNTECEWPGCSNTINLELDHKFPFSLGGDNTKRNIQTLCKWCNGVKGNNPLMIMKWPGEL